MINHLKSLCILALLLLVVAYACIALYGKVAGNGAGAYYSEEIDATCVTERDFGALAISCMPGDRFNLRTEKEQ